MITNFADGDGLQAVLMHQRPSKVGADANVYKLEVQKMSDHEKIEILRAILGGNLGLAREMADDFCKIEEAEEEPKRVAPSIYDTRRHGGLRIEGRQF